MGPEVIIVFRAIHTRENKHAARAVEALERLGILREVTGRRRDRVFAYERYIQILNEGADPL